MSNEEKNEDLDIDTEFNKIIEGNRTSNGSHLYEANAITSNEDYLSTNNDSISNDIIDDDYFDDDEIIEAGDDKIILDEKNLAIFQQNENVISWEIDNFYNDKDQPKNKTALKLDPPILRVKSSDGSIVEFVLTKELSRSFNQIFDEVYKAYFGLKVKDKSEIDQSTIQGKLKSLANDMNDHKIIVSLITILVLFVLLSPILF